MKVAGKNIIQIGEYIIFTFIYIYIYLMKWKNFGI